MSILEFDNLYQKLTFLVRFKPHKPSLIPYKSRFLFLLKNFKKKLE